MDDPTRTSYATLQAAIAHFNKRLFESALPPCLVTFQRKANTYGYFAHDKFERRDGQGKTHEIALNPRHFNGRSPEATLSTLVHEMVHLRQACFGKPGRGRYHNKEWADWMSEIGLEPSSTGKPGGKRTGDRVSHWIVPGGPFDLACHAFLARREGLLWGDRPVEAASGGKRSKYVCQAEGCGLAAWAKPGARLLCDEHEPISAMREIVAVPV